MKNLFFLIFILFGSALFALGRQDEAVRVQGEAHIVTGGIEEVDLLSYDPDPGLLEFIQQCAGEKTAGQSENDGGSSATEVIRLFRQIVRGSKYITCLKLADGDLAVFIIHKDISGEFSLLESYRDTEIFEYFGSFL